MQIIDCIFVISVLFYIIVDYIYTKSLSERLNTHFEVIADLARYCCELRNRVEALEKSRLPF